MILLNDGKISSIVLSSVMGHSGSGMFPYYFLPKYREVQKTIRERGITSIAKSSTRFDRVGNVIDWELWTYFQYVKRIGNCGLLNSYGLTNPGVEACAKKIAISWDKGYKVIPSFYPEFDRENNESFEESIDRTIRETEEAIDIYYLEMGNYFWILELNFSCPNSKEKIAENMAKCVLLVKAIRKKFPRLLIIAKTSIVHPFSFYRQLEDAGVNVFHVINTIPHSILFPDSVSPLRKVGGGGVSGAPAFGIAYKYNKEVPKFTSLPLIMGCGVTAVLAAQAFFDIPAKGRGTKRSVSICTVVACDSKKALEIIENF